jgi:hypothetical protein
MRFSRPAVLLTFALLLAPLAAAQPSYSTGFEPPAFVPGSVNGQNGWGHLPNSYSTGVIEPVPAGSPPMFGLQSLAVRTNNVANFGVTNHLFTPVIDAAGENGSIIGSVPVADPRSHFSATLWVHTPPVPVISTHPTAPGRFAELNPASRGPAVTDGAHRYAQVRLVNTTNTGAGLVRAEIGWYRASGFTVATVATLNWNTWYRFEYRLELVDGTAGPEPNDRFSLTIFDLAGNQLGTACGSTWELGWKSGTFDASTAARAVNGFDFASMSGPNANLAFHLDEMTMSSFDGAPLVATAEGSASVCSGGTTTLTAATAGGSAPVTAYEWRNAANQIVGTASTLTAGAGTYTVTVTDSLCVAATSAPLVVTESAPVGVSIAGNATIPMGGVSTLSANVIGGSGTIASYVWRDAQSNVVGTTATFDAPAGTYTVTVTDQSCGSATSAAFAVSPASVAGIPTATETGLALLAAALIAVALLRMR